MTALVALLALNQQDFSADQLFQMGEFTDAKFAYQKQIEEKKELPKSLARLGFIYELENDLTRAEVTLKHALSVDPKNEMAKLHLATLYYRKNDFAKAAPLVKSLSAATNALRLKGYAMIDPEKLAKWKGVPYQLSGPNQTSIPMIKVEPLPIISVTVNGKPLQLFIDTGGAEIAIDTQVAKQLKMPVLASRVGVFSGGMKSSTYLNQIDTLKIGGWTIKNVPACSLALSQLGKMFGTRIDGCLGSTFLMQYLSTLDYPGKQLILRKKTDANLAAFENEGPNKAVLQMWLAGDHFALTHAEINTAPECVLFVDTGYVGGYAKLGDRMIEQAAIKLDKAKAETGTGAGGSYPSIPFKMSSFTVGPVYLQDVEGTYEGPFPWQDSYGFFLAGMYGHTFFRPYAVTFDYSKMRLFLR